MKSKRSQYLDELLNSENKSLNSLHKMVSESIEEEELLSKALKEEEDVVSNAGERLADRIATFGGSWKFILIFSVILIIWIIANSLFLVKNAFDPYPFIHLNLILSCIAALQAPVIMMSQNRKEARDRKRAENDYLINLKAEIEIRTLHRKIDILMAEDIKRLFEIQKIQLDEMEALKKKMGKNSD
jgi:uncharacterized membrane protein